MPALGVRLHQLVLNEAKWIFDTYICAAAAPDWGMAATVYMVSAEAEGNGCTSVSSTSLHGSH